ncbi:MAG: DUF3820 family protein, partial [Alphaproteobacteria bacterium]|nr:DUF3820 family protein [Alphaproteobacteria bacterium]
EATRLPRYYATFPFGKHKDQAFDSIPADYLNWVLRQPDMEDDIKAACRDEFERRRNGAGQ